MSLLLVKNGEGKYTTPFKKISVDGARIEEILDKTFTLNPTFGVIIYPTDLLFNLTETSKTIKFVNVENDAPAYVRVEDISGLFELSEEDEFIVPPRTTHEITVTTTEENMNRVAAAVNNDFYFNLHFRNNKDIEVDQLRKFGQIRIDVVPWVEVDTVVSVSLDGATYPEKTLVVNEINNIIRADIVYVGLKKINVPSNNSLPTIVNIEIIDTNNIIKHIVNREGQIGQFVEHCVIESNQTEVNKILVLFLNTGVVGTFNIKTETITNVREEQKTEEYILLVNNL